MAFFLIPVALFGLSAAAGTKGAVDIHKANRLRRSAKERKAAAEAAMDASQGRTERAVEASQENFGQLMTVRLSALSQLDEVVAWLEAGTVDGETWESIPEAERPDFPQWESMARDAGIAIKDIVKAVGVGAGSKALAMQAVVWFGKASTGTAIKHLSGAAAKKATLAALGGGALKAGGGGIALGTTALGALNIGVTVMGVGFTARKLAASYDTSIRDYEAQVETEVAAQEVLRKSLTVMRRRTTQLRRAINAVAHEVRRLLDHGDPTDRAQWVLMVGLARALSQLARYKVMDEAGNLAKGWKNPYRELVEVDLEPSDHDFDRMEEKA